MLRFETMRHSYLADGSIELATESASFVYTRLRPRHLLVVGRGQDVGAFGPASTEEIAAELRRFPGGCDVYIDTTAVVGVASVVREQWTRWLAAHRDRVTVHVATAAGCVDLAVKVAGHFSGMREGYRVYPSEAGFLSALRGAVPGFERRLQAPRVEVATTRTPTSVELRDGHCTAVVSDLAPGVVLLRIAGRDRGVFSSGIFDALAERMAKGPIRLFLDARDVAAVPFHVSNLWTSWLEANRGGLRSIDGLATSKATALTIGLAGLRSRSHGILRMWDERSFDRATAARASAERADEAQP